MTTSSTRLRQDAAVGGRGPLAPRFAFPIIDRMVHAQAVRALGIDAQTPTIVRICVERPANFRFRAGQHVLLRLQTERGPDLRPLSLASPPQADVLEFATRIGPSAFKQAVLALEPGNRVKVSRPMGGLRYDPTRPAILVVGGIGITPVRSVLLAADDAKTPVKLLFSNRTAEEIPFREELALLAHRRADLEITWVLTSPAGAAPPGPVHRGRISGALLARHAEELPDALFYVTGPAAMVTDVKALLRQVGVPPSRLRSVSQGYRS